MKTVIITGIDSSGKTTTISHLPWKNVIKYPNNEDIKNQINSFYKILIEGGKELNQTTISNIYRSIHDLYDRDFRIPFEYDNTDVLIFDRYFIDNVVYSRMNGVERDSYSEDHFFVPDLVIMIRVPDYETWKEKFVLKGDENIREPAILFHEVQNEIQETLKWLQNKNKIKSYTIVEGLKENTTQNVIDAINQLISPEIPTT